MGGTYLLIRIDGWGLGPQKSLWEGVCLLIRTDGRGLGPQKTAVGGT